MSTDQLTIGFGSEVIMHFTLSLADGTVADRSEADAPLHFTLGDGTLIRGLELALLGLAAGDRESVRIAPQDAFGFADPANVHAMPRADFGPELPLEPGVIIGFTTPSGEEVPGLIREVGEETVQVDFNHPLAGHEVHFEVEILEVHPSREVES